MRVTVFAIAAIAATASLAFAPAAFADTAMSAVTPQAEAMAQPISAGASNDSRAVVCHHLVHEGMLMRQQVCLTKREWERVRLETQRTVSDIQVHSFVVPMK
jgi:hypothetical protein